MADLTPGTVTALLAKAQALVDAVTFDENGTMVAGIWMGGNGGMVSRSTIVATDALRAELLVWKGGRIKTEPVSITPPAPLVGPTDE